MKTLDYIFIPLSLFCIIILVLFEIELPLTIIERLISGIFIVWNGLTFWSCVYRIKNEK
jgi:hypothetical protein